MLSAQVMFAIFLIARIVQAIVNPLGPTVILDYTNCINVLIENNFKKSGVLIFAYSNDTSLTVSRIRMEILKRINERIKYSVEVIEPGEEIDVCDSYDETLGILHIDSFETRPVAAYFVIMIDTYNDFSYLASRLLRSRSWNPSAQFIVLMLNYSTDKVNIQHVEGILSCLFRYNAINVVVVVPQENNIRNAIVYGWRAYNPPKFCGYFNETARDRLIMENKCDKGVLKYKRSVFKDSLPMNMEGCVLYVIALERKPFVSSDLNDANIEKNLINELVERYNFQTDYNIINTMRGERESNSQWNGALGELTKKTGHVLLGGIFPDNDVHEDFDCSLSYLADSYTWVVPRAYNSPPWIALIIIFQKNVWCSAIAGFIICALSWQILGRISKDTQYNKSFRHCFLNAWICSFGFCAYSRPVTQSLRVFFVFFNIYCVIFITAYQTKLIDVLKNPTFEYQIKSLEDLVNSGLKFGGYEELHDLFVNSTDPFDKFLDEHWIDVDDVHAALLDVAVHRNFSVLCSRLELAHISAVFPDLSDSSGEFRYYAFENNMFTVPMEMVALRGFSFMKQFSETLGLFKQNGINTILRRRFAVFNSIRKAKLLRSILHEKSDVNSLSLQHLQGGFLVLALGYLGGAVTLLLEILLSSDFVKKLTVKWIKHD